VRVTALSITPVKGTRLEAAERVELGEHGVVENRRFFLIDEHDRMVNAKDIGELLTIASRYDHATRRLELEFPDGTVVSEPLSLGERVLTGFFSREVWARPVLGGWSEAISGHIGRPLRLVEADDAGAVDRGPRGAVTLISRASFERLALQAERDSVDPRRFRMLIEIDGAGAHEEDGWLGRAVSVGEAVVRPGGHVGRCVITSRDPDSGEVDLHTLKILGSYRRDSETTEPVAFGIFGEVLRPGVIQVGDAVTVGDPLAVQGG
jgi:uncharacterized protein YcbX